MVAFTSRMNKRCQKGLHIEYEVYVDVDADVFLAALDPDAAFFRAEEKWGLRTVKKAVRKFRFEVRTGTSERIIDFLHRATASEAERQEDRQYFEKVLASL